MHCVISLLDATSYDNYNCIPISLELFFITDNEPLYDFAVLVRNDSDTAESEEDQSYCYWQSTSADPASTNTRHDITCFQPLQGRYLTIVKRSPSTQLSLCEVQVYGGTYNLVITLLSTRLPTA